MISVWILRFVVLNAVVGIVAFHTIEKTKLLGLERKDHFFKKTESFYPLHKHLISLPLNSQTKNLAVKSSILTLNTLRILKDLSLHCLLSFVSYNLRNSTRIVTIKKLLDLWMRICEKVFLGTVKDDSLLSQHDHLRGKHSNRL